MTVTEPETDYEVLVPCLYIHNSMKYLFLFDHSLNHVLGDPENNREFGNRSVLFCVHPWPGSKYAEVSDINLVA